MRKETHNTKQKDGIKLESNSCKPQRLKAEEVISEISPLSVRLLKKNLNNLIELQTKENLSMNYLLNSIVNEFFNNEKRRSPVMNH